MRDKWYSLRCRIVLAKELEIAPDDLDVAPVLDMVECSHIYGRNEKLNANLIPDNKEQEDAIINKYYDVIIGRIFNDESPFQGFMYSMMEERGII